MLLTALIEGKKDEEVNKKQGIFAKIS